MLPATSRYIGVTTIGGHVARAIDFQERDDVFVVMGKPTPWMDPNDTTISDTNPPVPNPNTRELDDPTVIKKATLQLVVPDKTGPIQAYGQFWRPVSPQDAMDLGCRWVLVSASFDYNEVPVTKVDSYLLNPVSTGDTALPMFLATGYQVGDEIQLGKGGQRTHVASVDLDAQVITITDPLVEDLPRGTYVSNLSVVDAYEYRQIGVISHVTHSGLPGQTCMPYSYVERKLLEYYYNTTPIPRQVNRRDGVLLVLTF